MKTRTAQCCPFGLVFHHAPIPREEDPDIATLTQKVDPFDVLGFAPIRQASDILDVVSRMPV